jgi:putative membrane protein
LNHLLSELAYLAPWDWSPTVECVCGLTAVIYVRGLVLGGREGVRCGFWRPFFFLLGLLATYGVLQTYFDYLASHMFWVHRLQHLILHHLAPFAMVMAAPGPVLLRGVPARLRRGLGQLSRRRGWQAACLLLLRVLRNPYLAGVLFVGLVYFWLTPSIHFTAMLDLNRYKAMNWSMAVDGLLFWWLMLTPRLEQGIAAIPYGPRITVLIVSGFLQLFLGAFIVMDPKALFNVYAICGRAWAISPVVDQQIGGCLTWIPTAMMSLIGVLVVLHHLLRDSERQEGLRSAPVRAVPQLPAAVAGRS